MALILTSRPSDGDIHLIDENTGKLIASVGVSLIKGNSVVSLAFTAEDNISILRDKVYQREYGK